MNWPVLLRILGPTCVGYVMGCIVGYAARPDPAPHVCPVPIDLVRDFNKGGPVEVEFSHGEQRIRFSLGSAAGFPIVASPGDKKRWLMLPVKE